MAAQLSIWPSSSPWRQVTKFDRRALALVDGYWPGAPADAKPHYSRQQPGTEQFMASGVTFVLLADDTAVWGAIDNLDPVGTRRFRCSMFRNEGPLRSSDLIRSATTLTQQRWWYRHAWRGSPPLETEVDPGKVRRKRDPGRCFRRAGWRLVRRWRGLLIFRAPPLGQLEALFLLLLAEAS